MSLNTSPLRRSFPLRSPPRRSLPPNRSPPRRSSRRGGRPPPPPFGAPHLLHSVRHAKLSLWHLGQSQSPSIRLLDRSFPLRSPPRRSLPPNRSPPRRSSRRWNPLSFERPPLLPLGSPHRLHSCLKAKLLLLHLGQSQSPPLLPRLLRSNRPPRSFRSNRPPRSLRSKRPPRSFPRRSLLRPLFRSPKFRSSLTFFGRMFTSMPTRLGMSSFLSRWATWARGAFVFPSTASTLPI